jgi:hypothetical protein
MATALLLQYSTALSATSWHVNGQFSLNCQLPEMQWLAKKTDEIGLEGIEVKISAKARYSPTWTKWSTVSTKADGSFSLDIDKPNSVRKFKIQFRFKNDDLEIRHGNSGSSTTKVKWYTAYERDKWWDPGTIDLPTFYFRSGAGYDRGDWEVRRHAEIWAVATLGMQCLERLGSRYAFSSKLKIKYPHDDESPLWDVTSSYANPINGVIYLYKNGSDDHFNVESIFHEMGHMWLYQNNADFGGSETALVAALLLTHETHGFQDAPVAFNEGFAQFFADHLMAGTFPPGRIVSLTEGSESPDPDEVHSSPHPYNRDQLNEGVGAPGSAGSDVISSLSLMETHDAGWWSFLNILTTDTRLYSFERPAATSEWDDRYIWQQYGITASFDLECTESTKQGLQDVLRTMQSKSSAGYGKDINTADMDIDSFLDRLGAIMNVPESTLDGYRTLADPASSKEPYEVWGCGE